MKVTKSEKRKYVLKEKKDFLILSKIKELEKCKLNKQDEKIVKLIRTQLEENWRTPLIKFLNKLLVKYEK